MLTVGLPIIRMSVHHGTAYDIAGKGVADQGSLLEAIKLASRLARSRVGAAVVTREPQTKYLMICCIWRSDEPSAFKEQPRDQQIINFFTDERTAS